MLKDFFGGLTLLFKGGTFLLQHRSLWPGVLAPLAINILCLSAALYFSFIYGLNLIHRLVPEGSWYWTLLGYLSTVLAFGLAVAVALVSFLAVSAILAGPFNDWLGTKTLKLIRPDDRIKSSGSFLGAVLRGIAESVKEAGFFVAIAGFLLLLSLIPFLGLLASVLGAAFLCYSLAYGSVTPSLSDYDLSFRDKRKILAKNRPAVWGFGCACFLLLLVPLAGFFFLPVAVVGGSLVYSRYLA